MSILEQNLAPTPRQELNTAPGYIPPVDMRGSALNAVGAGLSDLAQMFDRNYVERLKLKAVEKRNAKLDERYAQQRTDKQTAIDLAAEHYATRQKQGKAAVDLAAEQYAALEPVRKQKFLNAKRRGSALALRAEEAARIRKQSRDTRSTFKEFMGKSPTYNSDTPRLDQYRAFRNALDSSSLSPAQRARVEAQAGAFTRTGRALEAQYGSAFATYAKTQQTIASSRAQFQSATSALDNLPAASDLDPHEKERAALIKQVNKYGGELSAAQALATHTLDSNNALSRQIRGGTAEELRAAQAEKDAQAEHAAQIEQTHFDPADLSSLTDPSGSVTPSSIAQSLGAEIEQTLGGAGISPADAPTDAQTPLHGVDRAMGAAQGVPDANGVPIVSEQGAEVIGQGVRNIGSGVSNIAAGNQGLVESALQAISGYRDRNLQDVADVVQPIGRGFISGVQGR